MRTILMLRTLVLSLILTGLGTTAQAVDMTGTWTGKETCTCFNDVAGKSTEHYSDEVMKIAQDGTDLNIEAYGELFNGNVINDPKREHKGEASVIACNTDPADNASFGELGRAKVSAKANGRGKMVINSLWTPQENELCQCRARFRRVDLEDPEIGDCSEAQESRVDAWHRAMIDMPPDTHGCHELIHPSMEWEEVGCDEAKIGNSAYGRGVTDVAPRAQSARLVGVANDYLVRVKDGYFTQVTGSFENVIGVTSITDHALHQQPGTNPSPDKWTLQLNTNLFHSPKCPEGNGWCLAQQQTIYANQGQGSQGALFIRYWLFGYDASGGTSCPSGWTSSGGSCFRNSSVKSVAAVPVSDLEHVHLSGVSGPTSDHAIMRIDDTLHVHAAPAELQPLDEILGLNQRWTDAEFNIFGHGSGSNAVFNANSSLNVTLTVDGHTGGHITCERYGSSNETNSLSLPGECAQVPHSTPPRITSPRTTCRTKWSNTRGAAPSHPSLAIS